MTTIQDTPGELSQRSKRSPRRRVMKLVVLPAAVIVLAAAGWAVSRQEQATQVAGFACVGDSTEAILPNDGTPPVEACQAQWQAGHMRQGVTTAPPLVACVNGGGAVEVIPAEGPDACDAAGMATWTEGPEYVAAGTAVRTAREAFHDRYAATGNACVTEQDWRSALESLLTGVPEWSLNTVSVESGRRCFDVGGIDPTTHTIRIIGVPGANSIGCDPRRGC